MAYANEFSGEQVPEQIQDKTELQYFVGENRVGGEVSSEMLEAIFKESPDQKYAMLMQGVETLCTKSEVVSSKDEEQESRTSVSNWKDRDSSSSSSVTDSSLPVNYASTFSVKNTGYDELKSQSLLAIEAKDSSLRKEEEERISNDINHQNSTRYCNMDGAKMLTSVNDSETKPEETHGGLVLNPTRDISYRPTFTATCISENGRQQVNINVFAKDTKAINIESNNNVATVVGDGSQVSIQGIGSCSKCQSRETKQSFGGSERPRLDSNYNCLVDGADSEAERPKKRHKLKKKRKKAKESSNDSSSDSVKSGNERMGNEWRFETVLSDFADLESVESDVNRWIGNLISFLLQRTSDLESDEVKVVLEEAKTLLRKDFANCAQKLSNAVELMARENSEYQPILTEIQFALAEFYASKGEHSSALDCLNKLEQSEQCKDTIKSRLYAKIAKIMEEIYYAQCSDVDKTDDCGCA